MRDLIRDQNHALHFFHVMYPNDMRSIQYGSGDRGRRGKRRIRLRSLSKE